MNPNIVIIETVGICNAHCKYCPQGAGLLSKPTGDIFISEKTLSKALELAKLGVNEVIYLHHRGEPFLHPNIGDIVRQVREAGFLACFSSNFACANSNKIKEVLLAGITQIEVHLSGGLTTKTPVDKIFKNILALFKLNKELRNNGCRIDINYALGENETNNSVIRKLSDSIYFDENMPIRFFEPHNWVSLFRMKDLSIDPKMCQWYKTNSCCVLSNGDIAICCLDQFGYSVINNIHQIEQIDQLMLTKRKICVGCSQYDWFDDWLPNEVLTTPNYLKEVMKYDSLNEQA
ncbi:MAG: radical SAM protein [Flavobacteriales bacterium]|nr:radical SAM protein [Flavobacteriales bacterium]MCB9294675.1 radical SAM protein [Lewinellaceae bacterium]